MSAPAQAPEVVILQPDTNSTVLPAIDAPTAVVAIPAPAPAPVVTAPVITAPVTPEAQPAVPELLPKRIVTREGVLRISHNIQAPSYYELRNGTSNDLIDYLNPTTKEMDLRSYVGKKVIVSGEESMDRRWKFTPVVEVESIDLP